MSSLTDPEKRRLERLFDMQTGKVYDYTDQNYSILFESHKIDINDNKYLIGGSSQAERMRVFWHKEDDKVVADVLSEILDSCKSDFDDSDRESDIDAILYLESEDYARFRQKQETFLHRLRECQDIVNRLYKNTIISVRTLIDYANSHDFRSLLDKINRLATTVETDSELAIGTAKELLEAVCKTILEDHETQPQEENLQKLVKNVGRLPIFNKGQSSQAIRPVLNGLAQVTQGVAELRNRYGTGHGHSAHRQNDMQPRHARLVVNSVITVVTFLIETLDESCVSVGRN